MGVTEAVSSTVLVDATGYRAAASKAAACTPDFTVRGGCEVELIAPHCNQDEAVMVVGSRYAPAGYGWIFPWVTVVYASGRCSPRGR